MLNFTFVANQLECHCDVKGALLQAFCYVLVEAVQGFDKVHVHVHTKNYCYNWKIIFLFLLQETK